MRFYMRAFLYSFVPFAALLLLSFLLVQHHVQGTVREGLRNTLRQNQQNLTQLRDANELRNRQALASAVADADKNSLPKPTRRQSKVQHQRKQRRDTVFDWSQPR